LKEGLALLLNTLWGELKRGKASLKKTFPLSKDGEGNKGGEVAKRHRYRSRKGGLAWAVYSSGAKRR